jgi:hypothetical protein
LEIVMQSQSSLDIVRRELKRRGLPSGYIQRVVRELEDHRQDLAHEGPQAPHLESQFQATDDRLGNPWELAALLLAGGIMTGLTEVAGRTSAFVIWSAYLVHAGAAIIPPIVAALLCCWLVRRSGHAISWALGSTALVAVWAGAYSSQLVWGLTENSSKLTMGLGTELHLLQMLVPLMTAAAFFLLVRHVAPREQMAADA